MYYMYVLVVPICFSCVRCSFEFWVCTCNHSKCNGQVSYLHHLLLVSYYTLSPVSVTSNPICRTTIYNIVMRNCRIYVIVVPSCLSCLLRLAADESASVCNQSNGQIKPFAFASPFLLVIVIYHKHSLVTVSSNSVSNTTIYICCDAVS
jgi:hypothetical protein